MTEPDKKAIGKKIKEAREAAGLNQTELGAKFGASHASISDLERGETKKVDVADLYRLGGILDRPLQWFLDTQEPSLTDPELQAYLAQIDRLPERDKDIIKGVLRRMLRQEKEAVEREANEQTGKGEA